MLSLSRPPHLSATARNPPHKLITHLPITLSPPIINLPNVLRPSSAHKFAHLKKLAQLITPQHCNVITVMTLLRPIGSPIRVHMMLMVVMMGMMTVMMVNLLLLGLVGRRLGGSVWGRGCDC